MRIIEAKGAPNGRRVRMRLASDTFTVADITFGCARDFAQAVKVQLPFDLPNIVRYRADLAARPSWAAR